MPPKKKTRIPAQLDSEAANASNAATTPNTPVASGPSSASATTTQFVGEPAYSDGWTDEQEITLFKAIAVYRWKPAGVYVFCPGSSSAEFWWLSRGDEAERKRIG